MRCDLKTETPEFVSITQAAQRCGLSVSTVRGMMARGALRRYVPVGGKVLVRVSELNDLMEASIGKRCTRGQHFAGAQPA